ncbi:MAG: hypothetical protein ABSG88_15105 [Bradyrhizobium sp.]
MLRASSLVLFVAVVAASHAVSPVMSPAMAETMSFESATAILAESCGKDIDANCLGVSLDAPRLKECLVRNLDSVSPQCRADYARAFEAIGKRVAAHGAVGKACERERQKICAEMQGKPGETIACLLKAPPRGVSAGCSKALNEAGYR